MNPQETLASYRAEIVQNAQSIFATMLGETVHEAERALPEFDLTGAVYYAGAWQGALLIECCEAQAMEWSRRIMQLEEPTPADARDGLGELANVLAGNLKPVLPPGVGISLPTVVAGSNYRVRICGENHYERVDLADSSGPFSLTLVQVQENG